MITKRSIGVAILLSIITCGIYGIYWFVVVTDDTNRSLNDANGTSGGVAVLLSIVTCGIYGLYWAYKQGEKLDAAKNMRGMPSSNSGILYLVLDIFGLGIISIALMQDSLNKISDYDNFNGQNYNNGQYDNQYNNQYNGQNYNNVHYNSQDNGQSYTHQNYDNGQGYAQPNYNNQPTGQPYNNDQNNNGQM